MVDILNLDPYDSVYFSHFWNTTDATIPNHSQSFPTIPNHSQSFPTIPYRKRYKTGVLP